MLKNNDALEIFRIFPFFTCTLIKDFNADVDMKLNHTEEKTLIAISQKKNKTMSFYSRMAGLEKGSFTATVDELRDKV